MISKDPTTPSDLDTILPQTTPLLPPQELRGFVQQYLGRRDRYDLVFEKQKPPLYILESSVLKEKARQFRHAFLRALPEPGFYFALKSNNHPAVAKTLLESDYGLDVSSGLELEMALALGARDIIFSGPGKTDGELELALKHGHYVVVLIDSFGELQRLAKIAAEHNRTIRAGVRLRTDPGGLWRKFGIAPTALRDFWRATERCPHIRLEGLQFHTSWNLSPESQIKYIEQLGQVIADLPEPVRKQIGFVDIGGGYWPEHGEWLRAEGTPAGIIRKALGQSAGPPNIHFRLPATPVKIFAAELSTAIKKHLSQIYPCRICLEPGRWICNDAMHLFISVVDKKADDLVITDAGTNAIGWERFETDYSPILNLTRPALQEKVCHILGSLCTPHDVWGATYWGDDIQPGDILMIPAQGAYTYSLRQDFIKPLPSVVTI